MTHAFFRGIWNGMGQFGKNINAIVNTALLSIVYLIGVGVTAIIAKIAGKQFLFLKGAKQTYWRDVTQRKNKEEESYRQF